MTIMINSSKISIHSILPDECGHSLTTRNSVVAINDIYIYIKAKQSMHKRNSEKYVNVVALRVPPLFPEESLFMNCPM